MFKRHPENVHHSNCQIFILTATLSNRLAGNDPVQKCVFSSSALANKSIHSLHSNLLSFRLKQSIVITSACIPGTACELWCELWWMSTVKVVKGLLHSIFVFQVCHASKCICHGHVLHVLISDVIENDDKNSTYMYNKNVGWLIWRIYYVIKICVSYFGNGFGTCN